MRVLKGLKALVAILLAIELTVADRFEGVLEVLNLGRLIVVPDDRNDIKSSGLIQLLLTFQPGQRNPGQFLLLAAINRIPGLARLSTAASLHFNENNAGPGLSNNVDFAIGVTVLSLQDSVAPRFEVLNGYLLASVSKSVRLMAPSKTSADCPQLVKEGQDHAETTSGSKKTWQQRIEGAG